MKRTTLLTWALLLTLRFAPAQTNPPRLIIRGDDMGYSHAGNEAILKCYKEGIEKSIEVLVPSPWFPEAVEMLKQIPRISHFSGHMGCTSLNDEVKDLV